MRIASRLRFVSRTLAAAAVLTSIPAQGAAGSGAAGSGDLYYERSFVMAADERCGLFEPRVTTALSAATLQARGAALRAGRNAAELAATASRAQARASGVDCRSRDMAEVQARVASAFGGWSRAARVSFPGTNAGWRADRYSEREPGWRLAQDGAVGASPVRVGLIGAAPTATQLGVAVAFAGAPRPYAARIVMRDRALSPRPWLAPDGLPPARARKAIFAARSEPAPDRLLPAERRRGEVWLFPDRAKDSLAQLDPREPFVVEFLFRDDSVARVRFEVGDFGAAKAFLRLGPL